MISTRRKSALITFATVAVVALVASISYFTLRHSGGRGYDIPPDACGIQVPQVLMEPLFPPVDDLHISREANVPHTTVVLSCFYSTNREDIFNITVNRFTGRPSNVMHYYEDNPLAFGLRMAPNQTTIGGAEALLSPEASLVEALCPARGEEEILLLNVQYPWGWDNPEEGQRLIRNFTEEFLAAALQEYGCTDSA